MNPGDENFAMLSLTIHLGAFRGRLDTVKWFIKKNKNTPEDLDSKGYCAIHYAAEQGHNEYDFKLIVFVYYNCQCYHRIIKFLLSKECDVDIKSEGGMTPLMCAAKGGKPATLRYLWEEGAVLHARDNAGQTAAHYAAQEDHADCISELLLLCREQIEAIHLEAQMAAEADAANGLSAKKPEVEDEGKDEDGEDEEPLEPLSEEAVLDGQSHNGTRPLHVAASFDSVKVIKTLLDMEFVQVCVILYSRNCQLMPTDSD